MPYYTEEQEEADKNIEEDDEVAQGLIGRILDKKVPNSTTIMESELHALNVWPKVTIKIENSINMTDKDEFNAHTDILMSYDDEGLECTYILRKYSVYVDDCHIL